MNKKVSTQKLVTISLLAAVSVVLMYFEIAIPFMPPFLKLDISAVPIMIGSFMFGPVSGIVMAFIKAVVHALNTQTAGVGELADFLITGSFAATAGIVYKWKHTKTGAAIAAFASILVTTIVGCVANWFILLPFYSNVMPIEAIIEMCKALNPLIKDASGYIWFGVLPFNVIKSIIVSLLTFVLYKRLSKVINRAIEKSGK